MEVTDVVAFEATRKAGSFDARRIEDFFLRHGNLITIRQTSFHAYLEALKKNPDEARIPNGHGESPPQIMKRSYRPVRFPHPSPLPEGEGDAATLRVVSR